MNTQVTVVGRAVKTKIDTKRDGRPGGILGTAVKTDLFRSQVSEGPVDRRTRVVFTLFAGFNLSFSKIF